MDSAQKVDIVTLPLLAPVYDHGRILQAPNTILLKDVADAIFTHRGRNARFSVQSLVASCHGIEELYLLCRTLAPQLGIGRILTTLQLTKAVHSYADVKVKINDAEFTANHTRNLALLVHERLKEMQLMKRQIGEAHYIKPSQPDSVEKNEVTKYKIQDEIYSIFASLVDHKVTLSHLNSLLDVLLAVHYHYKIELINITIAALIDICYLSSPEDPVNTLAFVFDVITNELAIHGYILFQALDGHFRINGLSSAIWSSRSHLYDVVYGLYGSKDNEYILEKFKPRTQRTMELYVDLTPNIPFKPMRSTKRAKFKRTNKRQIIGKRQFTKLLSDFNFTPNYNDLPKLVKNSGSKVSERVKGACVEEKLDGERLMLHLFREPPNCQCYICVRAISELPQYKYEGVLRTAFYSRVNNPQAFYGQYVGDSCGVLTRFWNYSQFKHIDSGIVDGEMVAIEQNTVLGVPFVKTVAIYEHELVNKYSKNVELKPNDPYVIFIAFDLINFNDIPLQYLPLSYRKIMLKSCFSFLTGRRFKIIKHKNVESRRELNKYYDKIRKANGEGVMLKSWFSIYKPGRTDQLSVKIKPEYIGDNRMECDMLIMGKIDENKYNKGGYLLGVKLNNGDIVCLGKLNYNNGMGNLQKDETKETKLWKLMKDDISEKLQFKWKLYTNSGADGLVFGSTTPDYYIERENTIVLQVNGQKVADSNPTPKYGNKFHFKDIRMENLRLDKEIEDCDTLEDFLQYEDEPLDGFIDYSEEEEYSSLEDDHIVKRGAKASKAERVLNKPPLNHATEKRSLPKNIFLGKTFCIFNDGNINKVSVTNLELCTIIKKCNGKVIKSLAQVGHTYQDIDDQIGNLIIIADHLSPPQQSMQNHYNILKFQWIADCIKSECLVDPNPSHILYANSYFCLKAASTLDAFGFNETNRVTNDEINKMLKVWLKKNKTLPQLHTSNSDMSGKYVLANKKFYILCSSGWELDAKSLQLKLLQNGGLVVNSWSSCDCILLLGVQFVDAAKIRGILKASDNKAEVLDLNTISSLFKKEEDLEISKRWYLLSSESDSSVKEALARDINEKGGNVVVSWENADYIVPININNNIQHQMGQLISIQRIVQPEALSGFLNTL